MSAPKSRRSRIRNAETPSATMTGDYKLEISVCPCGAPERTVTFVIDWWQWRNFARDARRAGRAAAEHIERQAATIRSFVEEHT